MKSWRFGQSLQVHQTAAPSLKLAAAQLRDLKARLQLHGPVYTLLSLPALLLPLCSDVILSLSAD